MEIFPHYEPSNSAYKITNIGNLTVEGNPEGLNVTVNIHAVLGGHVTVYFNTSSSDIEYY